MSRGAKTQIRLSEIPIRILTRAIHKELADHVKAILFPTRSPWSPQKWCEKWRVLKHALNMSGACMCAERMPVDTRRAPKRLTLLRAINLPRPCLFLLPRVARLWPEYGHLAKVWANVVKAGPILVGVGQVRAKCNRTRAKSGRLRAKFGRFRAEVGRSWAKFRRRWSSPS